MQVDQELVDLVRKLFPTFKVDTEDSGEGTTRIIAGFLSLEPKTVECPSLIGVRQLPGWLACLDNGEDCVELYEGPNLEQALIVMAQEYAKWKVAYEFQKYNPSQTVDKGMYHYWN